MSPVGTGLVPVIGQRQLSANGGGNRRFQWSGTDMLAGDRGWSAAPRRFVLIGLHVCSDHRIGMVQVDQNVAGVSVRVIGLYVNITALAVAHAQKSEGCPIHQRGRRPQPFAGEWPFGDGMNQTNQIQFVGHGRNLAADSMPCESESTIEHGPILRSNQVAVQ